MATREQDVLSRDRAARVRERIRASRGENITENIPDPEEQSRADRIRARIQESREPEPEKPGIFSRFFHEEEPRLGLPKATARGLIRGATQFVEGTGQILQAGAAGVEAIEDAPPQKIPVGTRESMAASSFRAADAPLRTRTASLLRGVGKFAEETGRTAREFYPPGTEVDPANLRDPEALFGGGAEAIGQIGTQIALAMGTGGAGAFTQFMMFAGPTVAMEGGSAFRATTDRLVAEGMDLKAAEEKAAGVALTTGLGALALERIPAARFVFKRLPGAERLFGAKMAKALSGRAGFVMGLATGASTEGIEEVSQEVWSSLIQDIQANNPEAWKDIGPRLAASGVFGAVGGTFGGAVTHGAERRPITPTGEPSAAPPVEPVAPVAEGPAVEPVDVTEAPAAPEAEKAQRVRERIAQAAQDVRRRVADVVDPARAQELQEAFTDPKTDLPNQGAFEKARPNLEADPKKELVLVDLRNFKAVNDLVSMEAGDEKLREVADHLRTLTDLGVQARDIFRSGGDEFVVAVQEGAGEAVGKRIIDLVGEAEVADSGIRFGARYGVGQTFDEADQAAKAAKGLEEGLRHREVRPGATAIDLAPEELVDPLAPRDERFAESDAMEAQREGTGREPRITPTLEEGREIQEEAALEGTEEAQAMAREPEKPLAAGTVGGGFVTKAEITPTQAEEVSRETPSTDDAVALAREARRLTMVLDSGKDPETGFTLIGTDRARLNNQIRDLSLKARQISARIFKEGGAEAEAEIKARMGEARDQITEEFRQPSPEETAQAEAEEEARILLGKKIASPEALAEIEEAARTEEERDADTVEGPTPAEPPVEPAQDVQGIIRDGEIGSPPPGGRPGGARDVREDSDRPEEGKPPPHTGSNRTVSEGGGTPGSRSRERRVDAASREDRLPGLDFRIEPGQEVFDRGDITKTKNNLAAIRTLRDIEAQGRLATPAEQEILVKYVGWGGLPRALDPRGKKRWEQLNQELLDLLTEEELKAAKRSVLNAHYTSIPIIRSMHEAMENLGIPSNALVLEPSMGNGHFIGAGPKSYRWFGVELDSLTGRIAQALYPNQDINVRGFETVPLPDNHFDAVMSNVPFGDFQVDDPAYRSLKFNIHNYFFAKSLDKVRPGGVVAFITSSFTMDAKDSKVRKYLAERADLLGAVRLPNTAFKANASTEVTTDIIFLRKKQEGEQGTYNGAVPADAWTGLDKFNSPDGPMWINAYFKSHQDMMLGTMGLQGTMRARSQPALLPREGQNLESDLRDALAKLPQDVVPPRQGPAATAINLPDVVDAASQEGSMRVLDTGEIYQIQRGQLVEAKVFRTQRKNVKDLIGLRDQAREVLRTQKEDLSQAEIDAAQKKLGRLYDAYVRERGPINQEKVAINDTVSRPNLAPFRSDPDSPLVAALENYDPDTGKAEKTAIFSKRVIQPRKPITSVETPMDALPVSLSEKGRVDLPFMADLAGISEDEMGETLKGLVYKDPATDQWVTEDEYLSGNVKQKLVLARVAGLEEHVTALEKIQPEDVPPSEISATIGSPWVPAEVYEDFINELLEREGYNTIRLGHVASLASWSVEAGRKGWGPLETKEYGTDAVPAIILFEQALNQKQPTVRYKDPEGKSRKDVEATLAAREKQQALKEKFESWLWSSKYADDLATQYNDEFNTNRERAYDGSHLRPAGMSPEINLDPHQLDAAWRMITEGNTLLAHVVGGGKTWTMIVAAMEQKRMGLVKKPIFVVPNHMLDQFSSEFIELYPSARILAATENDFIKEKRQSLMGRIATGDWDAVIVTHSGFKKISVSVETRERFFNEQIAILEDAIGEQKGTDNERTLKEIEKAKARMEEKLAKLLKAETKDPGLTFEELGVDQAYVDEAHYFKNLYAPTSIEGVSMSSSERAEDLLIKSQILEGLNPGRGLNFATATPISNSMTEVFTMMRYLQPALLKERGLEHFDAWAGMFGEHVTAAELAPNGSGYRMSSRFARFRNLPELSQMFRRTWDIKRADDLKLKVPKIKGGGARVTAIPTSPELEAYVKELVKRSENLGSVDPSVDNMLKITGDGRRAALDMRLVQPWLSADPNRKAVQAAERIFETWEDTKEDKSTQMVFLDISTPGKPGFNVYDDMRDLLLEHGIPAEEMAYVHDFNTDLRKAELFKKVRAGRIRVVFGSTDKMGVGTNAQKRLIAIHHADAPWRPADIEQRDGRGVRQGNDNDVIALDRYVTEGSFDAYMWQGLERKQFFIEQIMSGDASLRTAEDISGSALNASEVKALASGNPAAIEKASVDSDLASLRRQRKNHQDGQLELTRDIASLPPMIEGSEEDVRLTREDEKKRIPTTGDEFKMRVGKSEFAKRKEAGEKLVDELGRIALQKGLEGQEFQKVASIAGFEVWARNAKAIGKGVLLDLQFRGLNEYRAGSISEFSPLGVIRTLEAAAQRLPRILGEKETLLEDRKRRLKQAKALHGQPFAREQEMAKLQTRQAELEKELNLDKAHGEEEQIFQNDNGNGADTPGPDGLTDDELRERDDAGFLDIRPLFERRPQRDPLITSDFPEVEARYQANKGIQDLPLFDRAKQGYDDLMTAFQRAHPEIDPDESTTMALNQDILRQFTSARSWAMAVSYHEVRKVTEGLDENETDLLTRMLVLPDIEKDVEEGLYEGKEELPFGYADLTALDADLRKFEAAVAQNPKVAEALERRHQMNKRLTKLLVKADLLPEAVLEDGRYYHRQVMKHFQGKDFHFAGVGGPDVRLKRKGFQKGRVGGGDFNTAYQESEIEWMSQGWELLSRVETLQRLQEINDIRGDLKKQARALNEMAIPEALGAQPGEILADDPLLPFRSKIAFSNAGLAKLAVNGELDYDHQRFGDLVYDLSEQYQDWKMEQADLDPEDRTSFRFESSDWFAFLSHLMERQGTGAMQAATIFKAIREREATIKGILGSKYIDPTNVKELVRKLAPEGYQVWQPERGTHLFLGLTVEERVLEKALEDNRALQKEEVRQMLVVGGPKEQWIIPGNLARTLNNVRPAIRGDDAVENLWVQAQNSWKQWILLNPVRALKYNFNNMSGDADIAFAYDPKIITQYAVQAAKDLAAHARGKASEEISQEILEATEMGVVGSGLRVAEIPEISETGAFRFLTEGKLNPGQKVVNRYWTTVRGFTDWRENILRLAADRYFREKTEAGEKNLYAASRRSDIQALETEEARARKEGDFGKAQELRRRRSAKLARELIGDYGNISKGGQWLRRHLIPFYSWIEINAPRYARLLANASHEGQRKGRGRAIGAVALKKTLTKTSMVVLKMQVLFLLTNLWNHLFFPDEERDLGRNRRQMHLILGRREDGTIRSVRMEGALSDALEWFNLQDYPGDIRDLIEGKKDILDQGAEFVKGPIERIINSWEPFSKTTFEYFMGRSTYPSVFEEGKSFKPSTRPVRDRAEHVLRTFSLDRLYNRVTGKPRRKSQGPIDDFLGSTLLYSTDPGEASYWQAKEMASDWLESIGRERSDFSPTQRGNALYYWKKAIQWGDDPAAIRWEIRYRELGGTDQGMRQSIRMGAPMGAIAQKDQAGFKKSLTPKELELLELSEEWYGNTLGAAAPPKGSSNRRRTRRSR